MLIVNCEIIDFAAAKHDHILFIKGVKYTTIK